MVCDDPGYFMVPITHWISDPGYFMVPITHCNIIWYMKGLCTNGIYDGTRWDI